MSENNYILQSLFYCNLTKKKNAILRCNSIAKRQIERKTTTLHEIRNAETLIETEGQTCLTTSVVLECDFGLLAFPSVSPLASVGGCS